MTHTTTPTEALTVSSLRNEIMFKDGSTAYIRHVLRAGEPDRYLRAVQHPGGECIVDVRELAPPLGTELQSAEARDLAYHVFMTFRQSFKSAADFLAAAEACATHSAALSSTPRAAA